MKIDEFILEYEKIKAGSTPQSKILKHINLANSSKSFYPNSSIRGKNHTPTTSPKKQVLVKLISNINLKSTKRCMNYITAKQTRELKNNIGEVVSIDETLSKWNLNKSDKAKEAWHLIFSISEEKNKEIFEKLESSVLEVMSNNFLNHDFVYVIHKHQNNPHIHVILNKRNNMTKKKLHFKDKKEITLLFQKLRNDFALALNFRGLNYEASPRMERIEKVIEKEVSKEISRKKEPKPLTKTNDLLLQQINQIEILIKATEQRVQDLNTQRAQVRSSLDKSKKNAVFFKKINQIKSINKELTSLYKELSDLQHQKQRIKLGYIESEQKIKLLPNQNDNLEKNIDFLKRKVGKKFLSKKNLIKISDLSKNSITSDSLKKINIRSLINMIENKGISQKTETALLNAIKIKEEVYQRELKNPVSKKRVDFIKRELTILNEFKKLKEKTIKIIK